LKEIDLVKDQIKVAEEIAMKALEVSETASESLEQLNVDFSDLDERYSAELAKWEEKKPSVRELAEKLDHEVAELRESLPRNVLALYDRLYSATSGTVVARTLRISVGKGNVMWHCDPCSYNVRPQILVEIKGGELHQCESCKRILYWEEEAEDA
ncbi:MAG: hypothetical protein AAF725_01245, partial [Acidobacteriota bacterium]